MIKLSAHSHARLASVVKKLAIVGYLVALVFFTWVGLDSHWEAKQILSDQQVVEAALALDEITERRRKRRTTYTYHFSYNFEVDGQTYGSSFSTSESNADPYIDAATVSVAYKLSDPAVHDRVKVIERNASLGGVFKRLLFAIPLLALVVAAVYGLLMYRLFSIRD